VEAPSLGLHNLPADLEQAGGAQQHRKEALLDLVAVANAQREYGHIAPCQHRIHTAFYKMLLQPSAMRCTALWPTKVILR